MKVSLGGLKTFKGNINQPQRYIASSQTHIRPAWDVRPNPFLRGDLSKAVGHCGLLMRENLFHSSIIHLTDENIEMVLEIFLVEIS